VADPAFATKIQREANIVQSDPSVLSLTAGAINRSDPLGAATNDVLLPFAGAFLGTPADGLKEEVLISSSEQSSLIDAIDRADGIGRGPQGTQARPYALTRWPSV